METDSFFCRLFKQLPQTLFELLGLPAAQARAYRFEAVEVKKALRIDGLFLPRKANLPLYFVEVQFQPLPSFYANLFAKVFCYLEENDPAQEWLAVAVFRSRAVEPKLLGPYDDLLRSPRVRRIYLDEYPMPADPPVGLGLVQLVTAPVEQARELVRRLVSRARHDIADSVRAARVIELVEELLLRRFAQLTREEIRTMFELTDLRKTRVWQEAVAEGEAKGKAEGEAKGKAEGEAKGKAEGMLLAQQEWVGKMLAKGMSAQEIAALLEISVPQVRRLARAAAK
jgi:predicted transposase/invertase (TIGR01784 family)